MVRHTSRSRFQHFRRSPAQIGWILFASLALTLSFAALAQQDSTNQQAPDTQANSQPAAQSPPSPQTAPSATASDSAPASQTPPAGQPAQPQAPQATDNPSSQSPAATPTENPPVAEPPSPSTTAHVSQPQPAPSSEITENELKQLLIGKQLFLRGGYLDNTLSYNEHGALIGHSAQGSYTLNGIEINKVRLTRHKVELEGARYGLHFLGAMPYEDPTAAVNRVNITPKKKVVRITIDREIVVKPKKEKEKKPAKKASKTSPKPAATDTAAVASGNAASTALSPSPQDAPAAEQPVTHETTSAASSQPNDASEAQEEISAAAPDERPADPKSVTTTTSPAHANKLLLDALDNVFAQPFDARMMGSMPGFWKLYYEAAAAKTDYRPKDPSILRQNEVDQKAQLTSSFEPPSNEYAQDNGVAGMCLYHVVIGADGKPGEIAVARPIGFGLDENAVDSIRKATFSPAMKNGKPVPVLLDLVVQFRIYSKRTNVASTPTGNEDIPILPGPYNQHQQ
jgi:outer membrane biosynthesis protein TonB